MIARLSLIAGSVLLAGCQNSLNRSVNPAMDPEAPGLPVFAEDVYAAHEAPEPQQSQPSLTNGFDRSHWETVKIPMPVYQVEAQPAYHWLPPLGKDTARQRGEFPTRASALEIDRTDAGSYGEGIALGAAGYGSTLLMPIQIFIDPVWGEKRYPELEYERIPQQPDLGDRARWYTPVQMVPSMGDSNGVGSESPEPGS